MVLTTPNIKVGFLGDIFRFSVSDNIVHHSQTKNIQWLFQFFTPILKRVGVEPEVILPSSDFQRFKAQFSNDELLYKYINDPELTWARLYECADVQCFHDLFSSVLGFDFIIGFELPPAIKRVLNKHNIRYVNFVIHPVRFLNDLVFGVTTNCVVISELLSICEIKNHEVELQLAQYRAFFSQINGADAAIPSDSPVLIGQTRFDSSLIKDGRIIKFSDREDAVIDAVSVFDTVVFLEHPFSESFEPIIRTLSFDCGKNILSLKGNSYRVLFYNHDIPKVISLSSSLAVEASLIGHKVDFLLEDPRKKFVIENIDFSRQFMIGHHVFDDGFWRQITVGTEMNVKAAGRRTFWCGENYVRKTIGGWGYKNIFNEGNSLKTIIRSSIISESSNNDSRKREIERIASKTSSAQELRVLKTEVDIGSEWHFPFGTWEATYFIEKGFHNPENWGVWAGEFVSSINTLVEIDSEKKYTRLQLQISFEVYSGIIYSCPVLQIQVNELIVGYVFFRPGMEQHKTIEFNIEVEREKLDIVFYFSHAASPKDVDGSQDGRVLRFAIVDFSIQNLGTTNGNYIFAKDLSRKYWGVSS